jgi:predicted permease
VARLLRRPPQTVAAYVMVAAFANTGNFGLPIIQFKLGDEALAAASVYFVASIVIAFVISIGAANWNQDGGPGAVRAILKTPVLLAALPALFVNWLQIELPLAVTRPIALLAGATVPVMLLTLGLQLADIGFPRLNLDVIAASAIRLVAGPVLAVALATAFGLLGLERGAGVLQASMPAAVLTSIIALEHNLLPDFVTSTVLYSTLASIVTLTIVLAVM